MVARGIIMIAIIDYGMGNLTSVLKALQQIDDNTIITRDPSEIKKADKLILPGVGAFGEGMKNLHEKNLIEILNEEVLLKKKPLLGLCLGMQLLARSSTELGFTNGLGWIPADVKFLGEKSPELKVPHIGWNEIQFNPSSPLFHGFGYIKPTFYFVHSFHVVCDNESDVIASCNYGNVKFTAAIQKGNIFGTQFHPEKSQKSGFLLLKNFATMK